MKSRREILRLYFLAVLFLERAAVLLPQIARDKRARFSAGLAIQRLQKLAAHIRARQIAFDLQLLFESRFFRGDARFEIRFGVATRALIEDVRNFVNEGTDERDALRFAGLSRIVRRLPEMKSEGDDAASLCVATFRRRRATDRAFRLINRQRQRARVRDVLIPGRQIFLQEREILLHEHDIVLSVFARERDVRGQRKIGRRCGGVRGADHVDRDHCDENPRNFQN